MTKRVLPFCERPVAVRRCALNSPSHVAPSEPDHVASVVWAAILSWIVPTDTPVERR